MSTDRCVKWGNDTQDLFDGAVDKSLVLDIVISHACLSQTGECFRELVNALNKEEVKRKIKKINITDSSYLYRHSIPSFAAYADESLKTEWFCKNEDAINDLQSEHEIEMKSWQDGLKSDKFNCWHEKVKGSFVGDSMIQEYRDKVMQDAAIASYKINCSIEDGIKFIFEEIAYTCANLGCSYILYPSNVLSSVLFFLKFYDVKTTFFSYTTSKQAGKSVRLSAAFSSQEILDREIASFLKNTAKNVNFYVIDKKGNQIYQNYALSERMIDIDTTDSVVNIDVEAWKILSRIMKTKKEEIIEECHNGVYYLSVKSPLIINDKVEGIIGLSVDITEQKKAEELRSKLQQIEVENQKKIKQLSEQVAHDICTPLAILSMFMDSCKNLSEKNHVTLRNVATSIRDITSRLLHAHEDEESIERFVDSIERYVLVPHSFERYNVWQRVSI